MLFGFAPFLQDEAAPFEIQDIGVDVGALITTGIGALGAVVGIAVGGYAAFLVVRRGLVWLRTALR